MKKILLLWIGLLVCSAELFATPSSFAPIVKQVRNKVVHISTKAKLKVDPRFERFFENYPDRQQDPRQQGLGSGMIYSASGYIVTNNHVIEKADEIEVTLFNGKKFAAKVIGTDKQTDLALLKIEAEDLAPVTFGDSDALEIGDWVIAIGNPMGFDHTVTTGILSARGRDIFEGTAYGQFLQTDAPINPGNSGGPLFNIKGEVVGINTAIAYGQGLGFAIPSNLAKEVVEQLKNYGQVKRGWLGVGIQNLDEELAASLGLDRNQKGVILTMVGVDSPAAKAGLQQGDVLIEANGKALTKTTELQQVVAETQPGGKVKLKVFREGKNFNTEVQVGLRSEETQSNLQKKENGDLGLKLVTVDAENRKEYGLSVDEGVLILEVNPASAAFERGLRKGDVILRLDGEKIKTVQQFTTLIEKAKKKGRVTLLIDRAGNPYYRALPLP